MGNEIIGLKGDVIAGGALCLFTLSDGKIFFSETAVDKGDHYEFDAKKTIYLIMSPAPGGQMNIAGKKLSEFFIPTDKVHVPKTSIVMVQDITAKSFIDSMRSQISSIQLAK
jgi:hypothetical protein